MRPVGLWIGLGTCFVSSFLAHWAQQKEMAALHAEVTTLTEALAAQKRAQGPRLIERWLAQPSAPTVPVAQAAPPALTAPAAPAAVTAPVEAPPPSAEEVAVEIQNGFLSEAADPAWAPSARRSLQDGIAALGVDDRSVRSLECRKHSCRLETVHASTEEGHHFLAQALRPSERPLWEGSMYVEPAEALSDGRVTITTYFLGATRN
jgi:hypothetical protein